MELKNTPKHPSTILHDLRHLQATGTYLFTSNSHQQKQQQQQQQYQQK